jgi:hypothetical protein
MKCCNCLTELNTYNYELENLVLECKNCNLVLIGHSGKAVPLHRFLQEESKKEDTKKTN